MANINKIRLSGQTYNIEDVNASKTVELTQAQYDALTVKDPNTFYVITDAQGADLSNYYTKSETSGATEISTALASKADTATTYTKTEVDTALSNKVNTSTYNTYTAATDTAIAGKQDTLVSGTNIKTINNESLLGSGNIDIQGGGGTVDQTIISGSTNAVAGGAVYDKFDEVEQVTAAGLNALNDLLDEKLDVTAYTPTDLSNYYTKSQTSGASEIESALYGKVDESTYSVFTARTEDTLGNKLDTYDFNTYSASTDARIAQDEEVTAAGLNALNDKFDGLKLKKLTQAQYDALSGNTDSNTLYVIVN